ncbi:outer membrane lipoprotein carrier protein LolA [Desulfuromonas sp.]|uniref:LolA family protein n=1 Tax=Desulfuromonas sp. TaxID=892 RepID=UPI0025C5A29E|nr:outer membrane lipoprotein carrier protein LolA [Desulfuromonas sp.]
MRASALVLILIVSALALPGRSGAAAEPRLEAVVSALESPFREGAAAQSAIADFEADFFQKAYLVSLDRLQEGRGRVAVKFDRTGTDGLPRTLFRWEYEQPAVQQIVSDGRTMWVYLPENRQVLRSEIDLAAPTRPDDPLIFLTGLGNLERDFHIAWAVPDRDAAGNFVLELKPRASSTFIQSLMFVVDRGAVASPKNADFPILSATLFDPGGNRTTIEFARGRTNQGLPDSRFRFEVPEGVEIFNPADLMQ